MTPRWGKVAEGTTTTDFDEEEIARKISTQTALAHAEWPCTLCAGSNVKINFLDPPGYGTFINETKASLIAADAALIAVDAHVGTQRGFRGVIDLVAMKAHFYAPDGDGNPKIEEIPAALAEVAKEAQEKLV